MTGDSLVLSWVITWTVGLVPPYVIRKAIAKAPIRKGWAVTIALCLYFANVLLFESLGSTSNPHVALVTICFIAFKILRSPNQYQLGADDFTKNKDAISESVASKMLSKAVKLELSGSINEAAALYNQILAKFPNSPPALVASNALASIKARDN